MILIWATWHRWREKHHRIYGKSKCCKFLQLASAGWCLCIWSCWTSFSIELLYQGVVSWFWLLSSSKNWDSAICMCLSSNLLWFWQFRQVFMYWIIKDSPSRWYLRWYVLYWLWFFIFLASTVKANLSGDMRKLTRVFLITSKISVFFLPILWLFYCRVLA